MTGKKADCDALRGKNEHQRRHNIYYGLCFLSILIMEGKGKEGKSRAKGTDAFIKL